MTRQEIAELICRTIAVCLFATAVVYVSGFVLFVVIAVSIMVAGGGSGDELASVGVAALPSLAGGVVGFFFWSRASQIARRMTGDDASPVNLQTIPYRSLFTVAVSMVGVIVFLIMLRDLCGILLRVLVSPYALAEWFDNTRWQAQLWSTVFGLVVAFWLMVGSRGIVRAILWLRVAGVYKAEEEEAGL